MPVVRCLELALTESTPDVIQKKKRGRVAGLGRKKRLRKWPKEETQLPKGTAVRLSPSCSSCYLSFCLSSSFSIALSHPPINPLPISCNSTLLSLSPNFALLRSPLHPSLSLYMYIDSPLEGQIDGNA